MFRLSERVVISASSCTVLNSLKEHRLVRVMKSPHNMASLVLPVRIELTTSPLPRGCSTTELRQRRALLYRTAREGATRDVDDRDGTRP